MLKPVLATLGLLALLLTACGSAADNPPAPAASTEQSAAPAAAIQQEPPVAQQDAPAAAPNSGATAAPQNGLAPAAPPAPDFDDARVEGLVAEWETDLELISRLASCVENALNLDRPLQPEDFQLQANQPAILACAEKEIN